MPQVSLDETFYAAPVELLQQMRLSSDQIPKSAKTLPRLKKRDWHLTKLVWTFTPEEMHDLEFEPAIPALARVLPEPVGIVAAEHLARLDGGAMPLLVAACKSTNSTERINATCALGRARKPIPTEVLLALLKDDVPRVRLHASRCANANWDQELVQPVIELLRDPHREIREEATGCLSGHESTNRTSFYLGLLNDPDSNVRMHALGIAFWINRYAPSDDVFYAALRALKDSNEDVQSSALHLLARMDRQTVPKADLLPLLNSSQSDTVLVAANLLRWGGRMRHPGPHAPPAEPAQTFTSAEAAPLMTNRFGSARLHGLMVMQENADGTAVELTLPLLRDTNSAVRSRAFGTVQAISGKNISDDDPAKWEAWWAANKSSFTPRRSPQ